jgi:hypothetical protein
VQVQGACRAGEGQSVVCEGEDRLGEMDIGLCGGGGSGEQRS